MSVFTFEPATRQGIKPLICAYGESNSGKTLSMLLLARGMAGPSGKIIMGDTENKRGALYSETVPGGFIHCDFEPPFSPKRFIEFMDAAEKQKPDVICLDSISHEWNGEGGVLDMAAVNEAGGKKGQQIWKVPKTDHQKLILRFLRCSCPVIVGLRAKYKMRVGKVKGVSEFVRDEHLSPIQDDEFIFEATAHMEMQVADPGTIRLTKWSVPGLRACFPADFKEHIEIKHGQAIAAWANSGAAPKTSQPAEASKPQATVNDSDKKAVWVALKPIHGGDKEAFQQHLWDENFIADSENIEELSPERWAEVLEKVRAAR